MNSVAVDLLCRTRTQPGEFVVVGPALRVNAAVAYPEGSLWLEYLQSILNIKSSMSCIQNVQKKSFRYNHNKVTKVTLHIWNH